MSAPTRTMAVRVGTARTLPVPFGIGLALGGGVAIAAAVVGFIADASETGPQLGSLLVGVFTLSLGAIFTRFRPDGRILPAMAMSMLFVSWLGLSIAGLLAFVVSGEFGGAGDALFETVSATTTTGFTVFDEPQRLPATVKILRVGLQWAAGLGVLVAGMGVLPAAVSGVELVPRRPLLRSQQIVTTVAASVRNIVGLYVALTVSLIAGYRIAGMPPIDALSYGLSTASTGGMANHSASIGFFDSWFVDLVATAGMIAAGGSLVIVWWALRGAHEPVLKSTELRLYGSLLAIGTGAVWIGSEGLSLGDSAFAASSMLSTTGLRSADWAVSPDFVLSVLLIGAGIGAMSGSVGSGFRLARAARVALEVRRSLRALLFPNRVEVIRMDGTAVEEGSLQQTYGYLWLHLITLTLVAALVNVTRFEVVGTLSFAVSIMSNVGIVIEGETIRSFVQLSGWSQFIAGVGMIFGRLSIYPVLITASGFLRWLTRFQPRRTAGSGR